MPRHYIKISQLVYILFGNIVGNLIIEWSQIDCIFCNIYHSNAFYKVQLHVNLPVCCFPLLVTFWLSLQCSYAHSSESVCVVVGEDAVKHEISFGVLQ